MSSISWVAGDRVLKLYRSGQLQRWGEDGAYFIYSTFKEQVWEKLVLVAEQLQSTLSVESLVSEAEVKFAQAQLQRSLDKWADTAVGQRWLRWYYSTSGGTAAHSLDLDIPATHSKASIMNAVMKSFGEESISPFIGFFLGNISNAMLLQLENLEAMMLEALMQVDKVVKQNRMTAVITAAFPACAALYLVFLGLRRLLVPGQLGHPNSQSAAAKQRLRELLADVERSLIEVYSFTEAENEANRVALQSLSSPRRVSRMTMVDGSGSGLASSGPALKRVLSLPPLSPSCVSPSDRGAGPTRVQSVGSFSHNKIYIARGQLCFDILQLRHRLSVVFSGHNLLTRTVSLVYKAALWLLRLPSTAWTRLRRRGVRGGLTGAGHSGSYASIRRSSKGSTSSALVHRNHASPFYSWLPVRLLYRLWTGTSAKRVVEGSNEYDEILRDLLKVECRDEEVPPRVKLSIINKLRSAYSIFSQFR
jgi:hypothetical protein